ncbi:hypothetical protein CBR_g27965 [Chara braunii]|uniref:Uncharacterized protein n=1 Tax=Chara braunii TaxID=69332 RepID=A0A388L8V9_CHABU|nr:hypothetical protein CBR_g27965 [Chara braunii]|eukprot:GBG78741.1 hypothetical protein CBR_g27965 [Chara braunii]
MTIQNTMDKRRSQKERLLLGNAVGYILMRDTFGLGNERKRKARSLWGFEFATSSSLGSGKSNNGKGNGGTEGGREYKARRKEGKGAEGGLEVPWSVLWTNRWIGPLTTFSTSGVLGHECTGLQTVIAKQESYGEEVGRQRVACKWLRRRL